MPPSVAVGITKAWPLATITGASNTVAPADTPAAIISDGVPGGRRKAAKALESAKQSGPIKASRVHPTISGAGSPVSGMSTNNSPPKPSNRPNTPDRRNFSMRRTYDIT